MLTLDFNEDHANRSGPPLVENKKDFGRFL